MKIAFPKVINQLSIFSIILFLSACAPAPKPTPMLTPTLAPTATPEPTATVAPTLTFSPSPTPIKLDSINNQIIRDAYATYFVNKNDLINKLPGRISIYDMAPHKGIYWPFLVYEPKEVLSKNILVNIPNTGNPNYEDDDNYLTHINVALGDLNNTRREADEIGSVLLVPIFPRFSIPHTFGAQYLSRFTLETDILEVKDVDLQLLLMVDEIINEYRAQDINLSDKLLFTGYSAQSWFSSRFTALNPSRVQAVSLGGCAWSTVPIESYNGFALNYPIGLGNLEEYGRRLPKKEEYQDVHIYIYWGSLDGFNEGYGWDFGPITDGNSLSDSRNPNRNFFLQFGQNAEDLFYSNKEMFESVLGSNISFELLDGLNHSQVFNKNYQKGVEFLKTHAEFFDK